LRTFSIGKIRSTQQNTHHRIKITHFRVLVEIKKFLHLNTLASGILDDKADKLTRVLWVRAMAPSAFDLSDDILFRSAASTSSEMSSKCINGLAEGRPDVLLFVAL